MTLKEIDTEIWDQLKVKAVLTHKTVSQVATEAFKEYLGVQ